MKNLIKKVNKDLQAQCRIEVDLGANRDLLKFWSVFRHFIHEFIVGLISHNYEKISQNKQLLYDITNICFFKMFKLGKCGEFAINAALRLKDYDKENKLTIKLLSISINSYILHHRLAHCFLSITDGKKTFVYDPYDSRRANYFEINPINLLTVSTLKQYVPPKSVLYYYIKKLQTLSKQESEALKITSLIIYPVKTKLIYTKEYLNKITEINEKITNTLTLFFNKTFSQLETVKNHITKNIQKHHDNKIILFTALKTLLAKYWTPWNQLELGHKIFQKYTLFYRNIKSNLESDSHMEFKTKLVAHKLKDMSEKQLIEAVEQSSKVSYESNYAKFFKKISVKNYIAQDIKGKGITPDTIIFTKK